MSAAVPAMLNGFADEHVHSAIVAGLRRRGMDVVTVQDRNLYGEDDEALLELATSEGRLMLTQDTDFLRRRLAESGQVARRDCLLAR